MIVVRRGVQVRIFLTCWLVYSMHFATDFVREHYLVVSMVEDHSFDLTKYLGLHVDIFQNPPTAPHGGAHHGANPGISMVAAIPYFLLRPAVDAIVNRELAGRTAADTTATYRDESRPRRLAFYQETRRRGLDVRFGLVALITTVLCMAPLAAASVVAVFRLLLGSGAGTAMSIGLSLTYAFATPTLFRASYLNQNLAIGVFSIVAFLLLWNPGDSLRMRASWRIVLAGFLGGLSFLSDYSGALSLGLLGLYLAYRTLREGPARGVVRAVAYYSLGAAPGVAALLFYQWASFGRALYPPQHWMAPVEWIEVGYKGVGLPSLELLGLLLADPRYGLLPSAPLLAAALAVPFVLRRPGWRIPGAELVLCVSMAVAYLLFFAAVQYTRLQWVTGIRYVMPIVPFLFLAAAMVLVRIPRIVAYALVAVSLVVTWSMTLVRSQAGIMDSVVHTMLQGIHLPALTTFSRMSAQYAPWLNGDASSVPVLALATLAILAIWLVRNPWSSLQAEADRSSSSPDATSTIVKPAE